MKEAAGGHGGWSRGLRIVAGFVMVTSGLYFETWWGWVVAAIGVYLLLAGVFDSWLPSSLKRSLAGRRPGR